MTTMAKLEQELASLDRERIALRSGNPGGPEGAGQPYGTTPGQTYQTQTTVTSRSIYQSEPKRYQPVSAPKTKNYGAGSLPPPGPHKGRVNLQLVGVMLYNFFL